MNHNKHRCSGFSLIEMAVVMLIMGSLLSGLLVALTQTTNNTRITTAKTQIMKIEEALYAFAQSHGRLPCPAAYDTNGMEAVLGDPADGDCTLPHGFVPAASLSLYGRINEDGLLLDPWANPYRYSVAPYEVDGTGNWATAGSGTLAFTNANALSQLFGANPAMADTFKIADESSTLRVCEDWQSASCSGATYTQIAPAVVLSMGRNWTEINSNCPVSTTNNSEGMNAGTNFHNNEYCLTDNNSFVNAEYNEQSFDDIVIWLSPYILFNRLIGAQQLP